MPPGLVRLDKRSEEGETPVNSPPTEQVQAVDLLLKATPVALAVLEQDGPQDYRWVTASDACRRLCGLGKGDLNTVSFRQVLDRLGAGHVVDTLAQQLAQSGDSARGELTISGDEAKRIGGSARDLQYVVNAHLVGHYVLVHFFDVSEYRDQEVRLLELNDELEEAALARDEVLATLSHEVRTPLNTIVGYLEMIESEVLGPLPHPHYRGYVTDMTQAAHALSQIVDDLLAQKRFERILDAQTGYRQIIDLAPDLMAVVRDGQIELINPAGAHMLQVWPVESLIGRRFKAFLHTDDRVIADDDFAGLARGRARVQVQLLQTGGGIVDVEMAALPFKDDENDEEAIMLVARDVTDRQRATKLIIQREERLSKIVNGMVDGLVIFDDEGVVETFNPAAEHMFERDSASVVGGHVDALLGPKTLLELRSMMDEHLLREKSAADWEGTSSNTLDGRRADGRRFPMDGSLSHLRIEDRDLFILICRDVTERRRNEERMTFLATRNHVTELPNRTMFSERLEEATVRADESGSDLAILFLDIDHFKNINDTMGHVAGDQVLIEVAERLRNAVRKSDFVAHFGGDEYTLLLEPADADYTARFAASLLETMAEPYEVEGREIFTTISVGIVMYPENATDITSIMRHTDTAAHFAKQQGRNNYQFYTKRLSEEMDRRMEVERHLRRALEREELSLNYQPKVDINLGRVVGCEALLRWQSAELGFVSPVEFVPVAEETNLILPIGEWVLRKACEDAMRWRNAGMTDIKIAVNLSPRQFKLKTLPNIVADIMAETGLTPDGLDLEITESMLVESFETTIRMLNALRALGLTLSIDDFGTGYSSLSYLKRFPINTLKIDRQFIKDIPEDKDDEGITRAIISMAKSLELKLVAEGAETPEQIQFLRDHAVEQVQGYIYSKPLAFDAFVEFCRDFNGNGADGANGAAAVG